MAKGNKTVSSSSFAGGSMGLFADGSLSAPSISFASDTNTGMYRSGTDELSFATGGSQRLYIDSSGNINGAGVFKGFGGWWSNGSQTISLLGSAGGNVILNVGGYLYVRPQSDGVASITNAANTDFSRLQFGGTTSSYPALKRSSATLAARLADDSADATVSAATLIASGTSTKGALATVTSLTTGSGTLSGASVTLTGAIPAASFLIGVTARVTTAITGCTSWQLGIPAVDVDRFGAGLALTQNTTVDINNYTAEPNTFYPAATDLVITAVGGAASFSAGVVSVTVHYIDLTPATSN